MTGNGRARAAWGLCAALALASPPVARAQLALVNLIEARAGGDPFDSFTPTNRNSVYDQLDLDYAFSTLRLGGRFESYHDGFETPAQPGYDAVTQRYAEWNDKGLRVRVGNFYTILGRGLLHRSFEIPGVTFDQVVFPGRYAPSRDVDGVLVEAASGPVSGRLFSGRPNLALFAPSAEEVGFSRYLGYAAGAQAEVDVWRGSRIGLAYTRNSDTGSQREFAAVFAEVDPLRLAGVTEVQTPIYAEVARKNGEWDRWSVRVDDGDTAAVYASANVLWGPATLSAEWKDYQAFTLGLNDPPSLIPEHAFPLANRSTHFLEADHERGFQLEGSLGDPRYGALTLNLSRSDGDFGRRFEERYAELHVAPGAGARGEGTLFWLRGKDEFIASAIANRTIAGGSATARIGDAWGVTVDLEWLSARRMDFFRNPISEFTNRFGSLAVTRAGWGAAGLAVDWSDDPLDEDPDDQASPGVQANTFVSGTLNAQIGPHHEATLFVGERRAGPACTAGVCYVLESFKGVELRLSSRF